MSTPLPKIPPDRADGRSSWVHLALIYSGHLGRIQAITLLPAWLALVAISCWPWEALRIPAAVTAAVCLIVDWAMLALLPITHRSWGPVTPPLLGLTLVRTLLFWIGALLGTHATSLTLVALLQVVLSILAIYATWIEPFRVHITPMHIILPHWQGAPPLRILHISDLHFEHMSPREQAVLAATEKTQPDLILLTGDYLNLSSVYDPAAQEGARQVLSQFKAPLGVYAVTGSPVVDVAGIVPDIFEGLDIQWRNDQVQAISHQGHTLWLLGLRCTYNEKRDAETLKDLVQRIPEHAFSILMYHTPDLMPVAADLGVDLYLCGHTHGGQLRLPIYGAVATSSRWGKRYEMGIYHAAQTTLYVSRGLGMEGLGAPRARFLSAPEIILWTVD